MAGSNDKPLREQLSENGYAVIKKFLPLDTLRSLQALKQRLARETTAAQPHFGNITGVERSALFAPFILLEQQYDLLRDLGLPDSRFFTGYLISKGAGTPQLHWHQDWWGWSDPTSYEITPPAIYFMYYLTETSRTNGCLRVIPGSHLRRNELHALLQQRPTHPAELLQPDDVGLSTRPDEIDVAVSAGDLILRDVRLLHASHANLSAQDRDLLILSFVPRWPLLSDRLQCAFERKRQRIERAWPSDDAGRVLQRAAVYRGAASPIELQRTPSLPD